MPMLIAFHLNADPDLAFHIDLHVDPDLASQNNADPWGSGSATKINKLGG
jgi:hypothetical protein